MDQPTASTATAPENSRTIALQLDQLASGLRRVVMLPRGTPLVKRRKGLDAYQDEFGNTYYFQPSAISSLDIARAVSENRLPEILGPTDGGLGTKDKSQLGPDAVAVVARDEDGTEVHAAAVDPEGIHHAEEQAAKVVPPGGDVSVEPVEDTIAKRQDTVTVKAPRAPLVLKPKVKKPKPARSMAEIRAQQLIPYSSSKHSAMAGIQRLIQQQRFQDALKAAQRASAAGRLSHDEIEHAVDRGLDTPLVADAKRLDLEKLVSILPLASPEERKKILPALGDKLDSELRNMMPVERKSILAALVKLRMLKPEDAVT